VALPGAVAGENLLAVETRGLERSRPGLRAGEDEHELFQGWLLDQFVVSGEPYEVVDRFEVVDVREGAVELAARGLGVTVRYEAGARWASEPAALGCAPPGGSAAAAFREYLRGLRPRRRERVAVYSALGWYDFTNPADPLFELDADLVREHLAALDGLPFD